MAPHHNKQLSGSVGSHAKVENDILFALFNTLRLVGSYLKW